jgi:hypothetical protein
MLTRYVGLVASACTIFAALVSACGSSSANAPSSATVGPSGGSIDADGVRLDIPAGALPNDVSISIVATTDAPPPDYDGLSPVFEFSPDGLTFAKPARVAIVYHDDPSAASIVWSSGSTFEELPSSASGGSMTADITHFSRGFVGKKHPGAPHDSGPSDAAPDDVFSADAPTDGDADGDGKACFPLSSICDAGSQCCSGACGAGACVSSCKSTGTGCSAPSDCCSGICTSGGICK